MSLTLTIAHNIFLTREERYALHAGNTIDVVGVSIPVWFDKNVTSEPAREVFCRYVLQNDPLESSTRIITDGYQIPLPNENIKEEPISDEIWRSLSNKELYVYYENQGIQASSKNLLDVVPRIVFCVRHVWV